MSESSRLSFLPPPMVVNQALADRWLGKQVRVDAERAGLLKPCCRKQGKRDSVFYAFKDLLEVGEKMAAGAYPGQKKGEAA